jgi:hypothetical protein
MASPQVSGAYWKGPSDVLLDSRTVARSTLWCHSLSSLFLGRGRREQCRWFHSVGLTVTDGTQPLHLQWLTIICVVAVQLRLWRRHMAPLAGLRLSDAALLYGPPQRLSSALLVRIRAAPGLAVCLSHLRSTLAIHPIPPEALADAAVPPTVGAHVVVGMPTRAMGLTGVRVQVLSPGLPALRRGPEGRPVLSAQLVRPR